MNALYHYAAVNFNLDVAIRYHGVARLLSRFGWRNPRLLEVGAGAVSIGQYFRCRVTSVDRSFSCRYGGVPRVIASACRLPFADAEWDIVCSIDMLEHIAPHLRPQALHEMVRVAKHLTVVAVPVGRHSYDHDVELHNYHIQQHGFPHRFSGDHVEYGLPTSDMITEELARAASDFGRAARISRFFNNNLAFRRWYMRIAFHRSALAKPLYAALFPLAYAARLFESGRCYRQIFIVQQEH